MKRLFAVSFLLAMLVNVRLAHGQQLTVEDSNGRQAILSRSDIEALPHLSVAVTDHGGKPAQFEGVEIATVLAKSGITLGESLRGKRLATCLLVQAADGYSAVIALPELDPDFTEQHVLLAFLRDGKPLSDTEGPYRIVIPKDKRMARWVRQVKSLKITEVK